MASNERVLSGLWRSPQKSLLSDSINQSIIANWRPGVRERHAVLFANVQSSTWMKLLSLIEAGVARLTVGVSVNVGACVYIRESEREGACVYIREEGD
jgi:hypothetical protein